MKGKGLHLSCSTRYVVSIHSALLVWVMVLSIQVDAADVLVAGILVQLMLWFVHGAQMEGVGNTVQWM